MLKRIEEKARTGITKEEALALALEQSELNTIYRDLVLMGRAEVKLMERQVDASLSLPKHQEGLVEGMRRLIPDSLTRQQAELWAGQNICLLRPGGKIYLLHPATLSPGDLLRQEFFERARFE